MPFQLGYLACIEVFLDDDSTLGSVNLMEVVQELLCFLVSCILI